MNTTIEQEEAACNLLTSSNCLPGVTRVVALNTLTASGPSDCLAYLLGVTDSMAAIGHPQIRDIQNLRRAVRTALKGREE